MVAAGRHRLAAASPALRTVLTPVLTPALAPVLVLVAAAWAITLVAQLTGTAALLHHHALISPGGPPLWLGSTEFLAGWTVMVAGMMLPASLPAIRLAGRARIVPFLLSDALVWTAFGFVAFIGDVVVHATVHATPWLFERPWVVSLVVLLAAGLYQLTPLKRRALDGCRHPLARHTVRPASVAVGGFEGGFRHAVDCLGSSWALMLVMFAAGFADLAWMLVLTGVMTYEAIGRHGHRLAALFGLVLLLAAGTTGATGLT
jgi:predicted metal-binding membrane protein